MNLATHMLTLYIMGALPYPWQLVKEDTDAGNQLAYFVSSHEISFKFLKASVSLVFINPIKKSVSIGKI